MTVRQFIPAREAASRFSNFEFRGANARGKGCMNSKSWAYWVFSFRATPPRNPFSKQVAHGPFDRYGDMPGGAFGGPESI
jgi:hypothetical protein